MAQLETQKSMEFNGYKKNKIDNFLNTTKSNASRIQREKQEKKVEDINSKSLYAQRQKEVKAKYTTLMEKKKPKEGINMQPTKVDWSKVSNGKGVSIPTNKVRNY